MIKGRMLRRSPSLGQFAPTPNSELNTHNLKKMDLENSKAQLRKGMLEYCILSIVSEKEMYASDIMEKLKGAKLIVVEGTLYPLLTRLKNDGLLNYRWEESKSGPPRKYYELTGDGRQFLLALDESWNELVASVKHLTDKKTL